MSLADELEAEPGRYVRHCGTCDWYNTLNVADRAAFDDWLATGGKIVQLHRATQRMGYPLSLSSMRNHVRACDVTR